MKMSVTAINYLTARHSLIRLLSLLITLNGVVILYFTNQFNLMEITDRGNGKSKKSILFEKGFVD